MVDMKIIKLFSFFRSTSELSRSGRKSLKSRRPSFAAVRSDTWDFPPRSRIPFYKRWVPRTFPALMSDTWVFPPRSSIGTVLQEVGTFPVLGSCVPNHHYVDAGPDQVFSL
jgi:hypothetical protein